MGVMDCILLVQNEIILIIVMVEEIVFQINLLVFNVCVEVVRVGEYGCGFVVVVIEVQQLVVWLICVVNEVGGLIEKVSVEIDGGVKIVK